MLKVFLVDDEKVIREGIRDKIPWEQYGFQFVGEAGDGEMALPLIRKTRPDVVITDIKMPFMDGLSLSKVLHEEFPKTRVIIISGYDDFEYARQAIKVGVDQYLLKPITRATLRNTLLELKEKIEQDLEQNDYQKKYESEIHEYEQFSHRRFFEKVLEGKLPVKEIYIEAARQKLDLSASSYNLLFLCMHEKVRDHSRNDNEYFMRKQEEVLHFFLRNPQYILFRWDIDCYGVLIKAEPVDVMEKTEKCLAHIRKICAPEKEHLEWYVATGNPVERMSLLPQCYRQVNQLLAYRFVIPDVHIFTEERVSKYLTGHDNEHIGDVDSAKVNPEIIRDFLARGNESEIPEFAQSYLQSIQSALKSRMFRDYVILNIHFTITGYVESLHSVQSEQIEKIKNSRRDMHMESEEVFDYFADMLHQAIRLREQESGNQGGEILKRAMGYIDQNFADPSLSLNAVAGEVDVSANYLSAMFSQKLQKTFVEYVTEKRIERAKKLLQTTDLSSGKIATEIGYKDAHYFSFVFKKIEGCSPREYRTKNK